MNPDHLRAAIERIGIEKYSDYTLAMEEVGRMEAEEKLVERVARSIVASLHEDASGFGYIGDADNLTDVVVDDRVDMIAAAKATIDASGLLPLLSAAEAFISEAERMGYGKTSEKALPGSFDALVKAVREVKG